MRVVILLFWITFMNISPANAQYEGEKVAKVSNVVDSVYRELRWTVASFETKLGFLPKDFWHDPYMLGLFHVYSVFYIRVHSDSAGLLLTGEEIKLAEIEVLQLISETSDFRVAQRIIKFFNEADPKFGDGVENAKKIINAIMGNINEDDPDVKKAKILSDNLARNIFDYIPSEKRSSFAIDDPREEISFALFYLLFIEYAENKWKHG